MRAVALSLLAAFALAPAPAADAADRAALAATIQKLADDYVATWAEVEHTSGISISVNLPGDPATVDVVAGHVSRDPEAAPTTPATLFQIGSITKSFTAAALLQLQTEGKLDLDDTLGEWLPEYPAWKDVSIRRLLNMTSGVRPMMTRPQIAIPSPRSASTGASRPRFWWASSTRPIRALRRPRRATTIRTPTTPSPA
ncbi:MAG: beta-lactamase family protein [Rhodobacteraceae bacterium]|nr:beta-lactamase family protein [Paracoccaceae bacterium]